MNFGNEIATILGSGMRRSQNFEKVVSYIFRLFDVLIFFPFPFLFAAVIDLLPGQLAIKKTSKRRPIFTMEQPAVVAGNFALSRAPLGRSL